MEKLILKNVISGIYKITSPVNKIYIGQSINIHRRWMAYYSLNCKSQILLYYSLKKYGVKNHKFEIIYECSKEYLDDFEDDFIYLYNSKNSINGLNLRDSEIKHLKIHEINKCDIKRKALRTERRNIDKILNKKIWSVFIETNLYNMIVKSIPLPYSGNDGSLFWILIIFKLNDRLRKMFFSVHFNGFEKMISEKYHEIKNQFLMN